MPDIDPQTRRDWLCAAAGSLLPIPDARAEKPAIVHRQVLDAAPWGARYGPAVVEFEDRLWVMGGTANLHDGSQFNDVWSSADGVRWRKELASARWPPRWVPAVFSFRGKIWLIGGLASVEPIRNLNDVWSSNDGKKWTLEVPDAPWTARHVWATATHRGRIFLLGGATDGKQYYQDVLSSEDGRNWRSARVREPWFEKRKNLAAASYGGKLYVAGGSGFGPSRGMLRDVWSSEDGNQWTQVSEKAPWSARNFHALLEYRNRFWLIGGEMGALRYTNDVWSSPDGVEWKLEADQLPWLGRHAAGFAIFRDKVWVLGGTSSSWGTSSRADVWTIESGVSENRR